MAEKMKMYARGPKDEQKNRALDPGRPRRKSLMNQYNKYEREYDKLMDNIPEGGLSKKDDDRRRELELLLRQIGSDLGSLSDEENP